MRWKLRGGKDVYCQHPGDWKCFLKWIQICSTISLGSKSLQQGEYFIVDWHTLQMNYSDLLLLENIPDINNKNSKLIVFNFNWIQNNVLQIFSTFSVHFERSDSITISSRKSRSRFHNSDLFKINLCKTTYSGLNGFGPVRLSYLIFYQTYPNLCFSYLLPLLQ